VFDVDIFVTGPPGTADAPLASDNDNPAAPNTGKALLRRLCFEACFAYDMVEPFRYLGQMFENAYRMLGIGTRQGGMSQD
jgi:hypothetical protein